MDRISWYFTGGSDQDHPQEMKCKMAKWLSDEALQIAKKEEKLKAKEKGDNIPIWMQSSKE